MPGIGVKTAAELIKTYGDLDTLLARAGEIKQPKRRETLQQNAEMARVSRELVRLRNDVPVTATLDSFARRDPDRDQLLAFLKENQFRAIIARLEGSTPSGQAGADGKPATAAKSAPKPAKPTGAGGYELVQTAAALDGWIERALAAGAVAFDTETTSLDPMKARLVGFSLSIEPGAACYVPVGHRAKARQGSFDLDDGGAGGEEVPDQIPLQDAIASLKPLLEHPGVLKIGHNIKYDWEIMRRLGIVIAPVDDTMLISYVLEGGAHGHGMDELATLHLNHSTIKYGEVTGTGKSQVTFDYVPLDKARDYAAEDADVTLRLHGALKPRLVAERMTTVYETLERPLVPVLCAMERTGIKVDRKVLRRLSNDFATRIAELETQIHKLAGRPFTIGSPKQLGEILFDKMSLPGGRRTKTGAWSTDAT
ncbi:MAG: DNA polymerase, partial [Pseudomonadota bacterium]